MIHFGRLPAYRFPIPVRDNDEGEGLPKPQRQECADTAQPGWGVAYVEIVRRGPRRMRGSGQAEVKTQSVMLTCPPLRLTAYS